MRKILFSILPILLIPQGLFPAELKYKERLLPLLVAKAPKILDTYNPQTGHFGKGVWICQDQNVMFPLAVLYSSPSPENKYYKDKNLLEIIMKAGDALIQDMDQKGQWVFRKKDSSTWGMIWMPWTYSRWIRAFLLIRDDMPEDRRALWGKALTLGYTGISQNELEKVHNIPVHHAMGLYLAGKALNKPQWSKDAVDFLHKAVETQSEAGYWAEGEGPVVAYNFVYIDALGVYYSVSRDPIVLPALERGALFHSHFTYPGGQSVETIDQRNPYKNSINTGNVGFTFTPLGRAWLDSQWAKYGIKNLSEDLIASLVLYGDEGEIAETPPAGSGETFSIIEKGATKALVLRQGPWFICLSAYTSPIFNSRWIQDRQNFVSIYHDKTGLIIGGGNTKLQPAWSNFTVGDINLLKHTPGDTDPKFVPSGELYYIPTTATLFQDPALGLDLCYGPEKCSLRVYPKSDTILEYEIETSAESQLPVIAHLTLIPHLGETLETGGGQKFILGESRKDLSPQELGGSFTFAGYRLSLPDVASLHWPALPHDPYKKDGAAEPSQGLIEIRIPFDAPIKKYRITLEILR